MREVKPGSNFCGYCAGDLRSLASPVDLKSKRTPQLANILMINNAVVLSSPGWFFFMFIMYASLTGFPDGYTLPFYFFTWCCGISLFGWLNRAVGNFNNSARKATVAFLIGIFPFFLLLEFMGLPGWQFMVLHLNSPILSGGILLIEGIWILYEIYVLAFDKDTVRLFTEGTAHNNTNELRIQ